MLHAFTIVFQLIWSLIKIPLYVFGFLIVCFIVACLIQAIAMMLSGRKLPRSEGVTRVQVKRHGFLRCWFLDAPIRYVNDLFNRKPGYFPYQGCIVFCGRQGAGKTISAVEFIRHMHSEFPRSKVITNCDLVGQDLPLYDWTPLVNYKNDIYGVIAFIDEMQNWFSSNQSKDFPPEMLQVITQNRKNRRIIIGTAQVFNRLSKPLREQTTEVRQCITLFGCLTFVIRREPFLDTEGNVEKMKFRGMYYFVHDDALRASYDTYKVIDSLMQSGFQPKAAESVIKINQIVQAKGKR
ncbi:MAG: AAA family ATPase [Prevotella sp.]|nr:AAA family ATPase [Prevotella sp.]